MKNPRAHPHFLACLALALLALPIGRPAAHETDHYAIPPGRHFADLGPYFTAYYHDGIERGLGRLNKAIDEAPDADVRARLQSPRAVPDAVYDALPNGYFAIEDVERTVQSSAMAEQYPGYVVGYKNQFKASYTHLPFDPRALFKFWFASHFKVFDTYTGGDKIGHFNDMGHRYYTRYADALADGRTRDQAHAAVIEFATHDPIFSEASVLGYLSAGAYSNGDQAANYAGFLFYRNLTEPVALKGQLRPPLVMRDGPHWRLAGHVRPDSDFFSWFVSDHWDEALNPSDYDGLMHGAMERNIRERTALILWRYRDEHDRPRPREFFLRRAQDFRTYHGVDYGHRGEADELLTIADVCFPAIAGDDPPLDAVDTLGYTPLHQAILRRDLATVTRLLDRGARIDAGVAEVKPFALELGATPLQLAAAAGHADLVRLLLDRGADVHARDARGATALHRAAGAPDVARILLDRGADVTVADEAGQTPLHWAAVDADGAATVILLRAHRAVMTTDHLGRTPLHLAARFGRAEAARALASSDRGIHAADRVGATPLHVAAQYGHAKVVDILAGAGALPDATDAFSYAPLHLATVQGGVAAVRALLAAGAAPGVTDDQGVTPLHLAARQRRPATADALLRAGARPDARTGISPSAASSPPRPFAGWTPLHEAAWAGDLAIAEVLLAHGALPDVKDAAGQTPRQLARARGHADLEALLNRPSGRVDAAPR